MTMRLVADVGRETFEFWREWKRCSRDDVFSRELDIVEIVAGADSGGIDKRRTNNRYLDNFC
ncbi:hypothetical protein [Undibacterium sp. RuRC25W]|uniref:hypothetical protein n=1 Tax=Undibacterium sp. RuRC25W TaxID=3413047 RepID=UPI003BF3AEF5